MSNDARLASQGETSKWFSKYLLYRNMKAEKRSLLGAYIIYQEQVHKGVKRQYKHVPGAWNRAFEKYDWKSRAEAYDTKLQAEQEAREAAYRQFEAAEKERILSTGLALIEKRVEALASLAFDIRKSFNDPETGEVNPKWLDAFKIKEYRGCLEDIAKELGARVVKKELTGKDGGPIEFVTEWGGGAIEEEAESDG